MSLSFAIHEVDPARLASGQWSHQKNRQIGEGDIFASYSADKIAYGQSLRRPFEWQGSLWVNVGNAIGSGIDSAQAYRLVSPEQFDGQPVSYAQKVIDGDAARTDANGFYHSMIVYRGGHSLVLCGPPVIFIPGQSEQLDLFA